jgi:hypothetical protein
MLRQIGSPLEEQVRLRETASLPNFRPASNQRFRLITYDRHRKRHERGTVVADRIDYRPPGERPPDQSGERLDRLCSLGNGHSAEYLLRKGGAHPAASGGNQFINKAALRW